MARYQFVFNVVCNLQDTFSSFQPLGELFEKDKTRFENLLVMINFFDPITAMMRLRTTDTKFDKLY